MDVSPTVQSDASAKSLKPKPAVPKKPEKLMPEMDVSRTTHVREMIRKLQEKEQFSGNVKPISFKMGGKPRKILGTLEKEEPSNQEGNQTLEDLKAIDEDIEKLRKQIEERDKIISALREAAEAKDKKLDNLMEEYSKLQSGGKLDLDTSSVPNRATSSSPSSPPLCNGGLCWTDSFVNKNYHEPVYAQLLNDHSALQKVYEDLQAKLESNGGGAPSREAERRSGEGPKSEGGENAINLIMAEQIKALKEREAQLIWEAEELREQNDLMEFRILELEECRKEFLDKEVTNEGKHRGGEKIVWRERDLEEISDSGVTSLPTSEDLTSDSELGEAIRNYSPLGALTNLGLPTSEISSSDLKKSLKSSECLQESGIFVDAEPGSDSPPPTGTHSKACQTESVLEKTLLDIIDSSCDSFLAKNPGYLAEEEEEDPKSDDLSAEISKLSVIQKRIQQKTNAPPATLRSPHTLTSCPHANSVLFYEERLAQLEGKLQIYESSGDAKDALLAKRLQKEVELAHRVKELTDKVVSLETAKRKLEEEKCEFEEAENDTRFQCQRLEIKLQELIEKNTELEMALERQRVMMNEEKKRVKKSSLEGLINRYEKRNSELEERDEEASQRLSIIEAAMPAIVAYNVFKMVQHQDFSTIVSGEKSEEHLQEKKKGSEGLVVARREEEMSAEQKDEEEASAEREKALRAKIQELEMKAAKDRETLDEMTNALMAYKTTEKNSENLRPDDLDLFEELKQMVANEFQLRAQIEHLEKKEEAYMQSLEKADEIWAGMEADYKQRLTEAEELNAELQRKISQLESSQAALEKALAEQPLGSSPTEEDIHHKIQELLLENKKLKEEFNRRLDEKFEEHRKFLETENAALREEVQKLESDSEREERRHQVLAKELELTKEELRYERNHRDTLKKDLEEKTQSVSSLELNLQTQISELTQELSRKSKELTSLEVTVAELREEVETLEKKVGELVEKLQATIRTQEEVFSMMHASKNADRTKGALLEAESYGETALPLRNEIICMREILPAQLDILVPKEFRERWLVFALPSYPRQKMKFLRPFPLSARTFWQKLRMNTSKTAVLEVAAPSQRESVDLRGGASAPRSPTLDRIFINSAFDVSEEIFQLSIKNTELQQTLERMEEQSRLKDKELEELQKIALEIRREQKSLEPLFEMIEKEEREKGLEGEEREKRQEGEEREERQEEEKASAAEPPETTEDSEGSDAPQVLNPVVVKTPSEPVPLSFSNLQIAIDNLRRKYRAKTIKIQPLLNELKQKGDNRDVEELTQRLEPPPDKDAKEKNPKRDFPGVVADAGNNQAGDATSAEERKLRTLGKSSSLTRSPPPYLFHKALEEDPEFAFVAPIVAVRRVGDDGVFMEWDVSQQPQSVTGFEIKVNGLLSHRVRSSTRNKALLRPLNLKSSISIHLFAISENGRSTKCSRAHYPDEYFL